MKQLGLDMVYTDPGTQKIVPWAMPRPELIAAIKASPFKVTDVETTGLNPTSKEQNFNGRDTRRGIDPTLRLRVNSVLYHDGTRFRVVSFDFDQLTKAEKASVCDASLTGWVIGHNVGFDAFWQRMHVKVKPTLLLDTMLIARVLRPAHVIHMAKLCSDESVPEDLRKHAESMFQAERSGWSLADLYAGIFHELLPKDLQGPKNWCEPFLSQDAYNYATGDVKATFRTLLYMFGLSRADVEADPQLLMTRYFELRAQYPALGIVEPQVINVVEMREHGMPWDAATAEEYVAQQWKKVADFAVEMVALEPTLAAFEAQLANAEVGVNSKLKDAIGLAFTSRGINLDRTPSSNEYKIGEKDLRRARAATNPDAIPLFKAWTGLNRAKKAGNMAREFTAFSLRSYDGYLHPNTMHGPLTGRLSSSEPNCQQAPRDQGFRNAVKARKGHKIVASDYSALDMRVGAALAVRAQRRIVEAYMGDLPVAPDVLRCIERVLEGRVDLARARDEESRAALAFKDWKDQRDALLDSGRVERKSYWDTYRKLARAELLTGFTRCLREVRDNAQAAGTPEWSSLRDAFSIAGMDIHTWTALGMLGTDPKALFGGLSDEEVAKQLKHHKGVLGDKRQTGKVGNLSLLYAMKTLGLMEAAAKNYNIHWTFEEADKVRKDWLAAYVEVDLWHKWTELTPFDEVYVPDPDKGKYGRKGVFASYTLGERLIYAFGLNAALSYEDQSTGADILGRVMRTLELEHPDLFSMTINQVHDELVFMVPDEIVEEATERISRVMTECAEYFLMPYGVKGECSPAVGNVWLKD